MEEEQSLQSTNSQGEYQVSNKHGAENEAVEVIVTDNSKLRIVNVSVVLRKRFLEAWKVFRAVEEQQKHHLLELVSSNCFCVDDGSFIFNFILKHTSEERSQTSNMDARDLIRKLMEA